MTATTAPPLAPGREAVLRALLVLLGICSFLNLYSAQSLLPLLQQVFGASHAQVGLAVSATTTAVALASPVAGLFVERFERRQVLAGAFGAIALATVLATTATSMNALVAWRFLQGIFIPAAYVAAMALIGETWGPEKAGSAMASLMTGNVLGGFLGRTIAGLLAAHGGWQAAFVGLGVLNGVGAIAAWICLAGMPPHRRRAPVRFRELGGLLVHRALVPTYVVGFVMLFTMVALFTYVNFHLAAAPYHLGPAALGCVFMVYLLGTVVTPIAGRLIDERGFRTVGPLALLATAAGTLLTLSPSLPVIIVGLAVAACGIFVGQSAATGLLGVTAGWRRAPAAGLYLMCYYAGGSAGGVVPAWAWNAGGWPACVGLVTVTAIATAALMRASWPERSDIEPMQPPLAA